MVLVWRYCLNVYNCVQSCFQRYYSRNDSGERNILNNKKMTGKIYRNYLQEKKLWKPQGWNQTSGRQMLRLGLHQVDFLGEVLYCFFGFILMSGGQTDLQCKLCAAQWPLSTSGGGRRAGCLGHKVRLNDLLMRHSCFFRFHFSTNRRPHLGIIAVKIESNLSSHTKLPAVSGYLRLNLSTFIYIPLSLTFCFLKG